MALNVCREVFKTNKQRRVKEDIQGGKISTVQSKW